jgi:hypothetical protein
MGVNIAELLAIGYLRHRRALARNVAQVSAMRAEKPLDDVAPEGRVAPPENRTPEKGGSP